MRAKATACLTLCCALLHGCIVIPVPVARSSGPTDSSRAEVSNTLPEQIVSGRTTRTEVLLLLGEPDGRGDLRPLVHLRFARRARRRGLGVVHCGRGGLRRRGRGVEKLGNWNTSRRADHSLRRRRGGLRVSTSRKKIAPKTIGNCLDASGREIFAAEAAQRAMEEHVGSTRRGTARFSPGTHIFRMDRHYDLPRVQRLAAWQVRGMSGGNELLIAEHAILGTGPGPDINTGVLKAAIFRRDL